MQPFKTFFLGVHRFWAFLMKKFLRRLRRKNYSFTIYEHFYYGKIWDAAVFFFLLLENIPVVYIRVEGS